MNKSENPMHDRVLTIDMGASYTKVALRPKAKKRGPLYFFSETKQINMDGDPLIPSIAVETGNPKQPWLFGKDAALYQPDESSTVHTNWKELLFTTSKGVSCELVKAIEIAGKFFHWLNERLKQEGHDTKRIPVRVCLPALPNFAKVASWIAHQMEETGWETPAISKIEEPHANILGVFGEDRNRISKHENPAFGYIFRGSRYLEASRRCALDGGGDYFSAVCCDIGSFTTDIAHIKFNLAAADVGAHDVTQHSWKIGVIDQLDKAVFTDLFAKYGIDDSILSFLEKENMKRSLYAGQTWQMLTRDDYIELGNDEDQQTIDKYITEFGNKITAKVQQKMEQHRGCDYLYVTGGGANIARLQKYLKEKLRATCRVEFTEDPIARFATALGGCSITLDWFPKEVRASANTRIASRSTSEITCTCMGGNKNCCFCNGKGTYEPPRFGL